MTKKEIKKWVRDLIDTHIHKGNLIWLEDDGGKIFIEEIVELCEKHKKFG